MSTIKKKGLGRGLEALLGEKSKPVQADAPITRLPLSVLQAGKYQPRQKMDSGPLQELAESIREQGVMQPLLVRAISAGKYEIIAGERRFRAATMAGLTEVPVLVSLADDKGAAAMALIENMQREDLNPLEESQGLARLIEEFGFTHEQAAKSVGKSRSAISNLLRLAQLAKPVQAMLLAGDIDMGHARALLPLPGAAQVALAQKIMAQGL
jgi:ParB family chromosome partitioning protein